MIEQIAERFAAAGLCIALIGASPLSAQPAQGSSLDMAVPTVEHASFHQLVFANDDIAVLNNLYPPGADSGFHAHERDLFYVVIQPNRSVSERPGQPPVPVPAPAAGAAGYSPVDGGRRVHRVINGDDNSYQIIVVELRRASPSGHPASSRENAPHYIQIVDNPRLRAWRLILEPGQSVPAIVQGGNGIRVVVRGGLLTTTMPGLSDQTLALEPGNFAVQDSGATRALRNSGTETIEIVELELK